MTSTPRALKMWELSVRSYFESLIDRRLVTGSATGSIAPLFDKILAIHTKHGPFDLALCIGDFFGSSSGGNNSGDMGRLLREELLGMSQVFSLSEKGWNTMHASKLQSLAMSCRESTHCPKGWSNNFPKLMERSAKTSSFSVGPALFLRSSYGF